MLVVVVRVGGGVAKRRDDPLRNISSAGHNQARSQRGATGGRWSEEGNNECHASRRPLACDRKDGGARGGGGATTKSNLSPPNKFHGETGSRWGWAGSVGLTSWAAAGVMLIYWVSCSTASQQRTLGGGGGSGATEGTTAANHICQPNSVQC